MRAHAISGPWAAGERVLVCVSEDPGLRRARSAMPGALADRLRRAVDGDLCRDAALPAVSTSASATASPIACASPRRLGGADDHHSRARASPRRSLAYAEANNITQIVIGKSERSRWFEMLHGSVVHDLVRRSGNISVHVIAGDADDAVAAEDGPDQRAQPEPFDPLAYISAAHRHRRASALGVGLFLKQFLDVANIALVFLTAVLVAAIRFGPVAVALRLPRQRPRLQFLLPAAALHLHHRRSRERRRAVLLPGRGGHRQQSRRQRRAARC